MKLSNLFRFTTKSGHTSIDAVKSAIQKYARRGMPVEMLNAVSEMDAFMKYDDSDNDTIQRSSKAIRTNMINILKVVLFEEVSFSQVGSFVTVIEKIREWEDDGRTDKSTLAEIVAIIANSKKLRLTIYLRERYGKGENCTLDKKDFLYGIDNQEIDCVEWIYHNGDEALAMLASTDFQFPGKEHVLPLITAEWRRLRPTKSKAGNNNRFIFIIVPWLWIMYNGDINEQDGSDVPSLSKKIVNTAYNKTDVQFDDFVYDKYTKEGKKRGNTWGDKDASDIVNNNDDVWLSHFEDLKVYYNNQPEEHKSRKPRALTEKQKAKKAANNAKPKRFRRETVKIGGINEIDIDVDDIEMILEGVRRGRLPCGKVYIEGKEKFIKHMTKSLNYGMDYLYIDRQKRLFGLNELGIEIRKIPGKILVVNKDQGKTTYEWEDNEEGQVIAIMDKIEEKTNLGKYKNFLKDETKFKEMIKIRLFNGLFRTSDNVLNNIIVDENDELWAIDENDIYGKRKNVFNKKEYVKKNKFMTVETIENVIDELDFESHEETLIGEMRKYFSNASCKYYEREIRERIHNYKQIIMKELDME
jgi:hypothetical protein